MTDMLRKQEKDLLDQSVKRLYNKELFPLQIRQRLGITHSRLISCFKRLGLPIKRESSMGVILKKMKKVE